MRVAKTFISTLLIVFVSILFINNVFATEKVIKQVDASQAPSTGLKNYLTSNGLSTNNSNVAYRNYIMEGSDNYNSFRWYDNAKIGDYLRLTFNNLDIKTSSFNDLRVQIDYMAASPSINIIKLDSLLIYIYDSNNKQYGPYRLDDYEFTGYYKNENSENYFRAYNLVSENLKSGNYTIKKIEIVPYGNIPLTIDNTEAPSGDFRNQPSIFVAKYIKVIGYSGENYSNKNKTYTTLTTTTENEKRIASAHRIYDLATIKWTPGMDMSNINAVSGGVRFGTDSNGNVIYYYKKGETYYGPPYVQKNTVPLEKFYSVLDSNKVLNTTTQNYYKTYQDGKYNYLFKAPTDGTSYSVVSLQSSDTWGSSCSPSVGYSIAKYIPMTDMYYTAHYIWDRNKTTLLGGLSISSTAYSSEAVYNDLYNKYKKQGLSDAQASEKAKQDIYKGYAELTVGDIVDTYTKSLGHVKLVTGNTHVECKDGTVLNVSSTTIDTPHGSCDTHGGIDPEKSYFIKSDIAFTSTKITSSNLNRVGGTLSSSDYTAAKSWTPNSKYTDLVAGDIMGVKRSGSSTLYLQEKNVDYYINSKNTFTEAFENAYLPIRFNEYIEDKIENQYVTMTNPSTPNNIKNGLKGVIYSNYPITTVYFGIYDLKNGNSYNRTIYPNHAQDTGSGKESIYPGSYSLYYNTPESIQTDLKNILNNTTHYVVKVSVNASTAMTTLDISSPYIPKSTSGIKVTNLDINSKYTTKVYDKNNNLKSSGSLATGDTIKIYSDSSLVTQYTAVVKGDTTGDGKINIYDVAAAYQEFRNRIEIDKIYINAGDVKNLDDKINSYDVAKLYQFVRGRRNSLEE